MKRLAIVFGAMCLGVFALFLEKEQKKDRKKYDKENNNAVEFTGPHGEKILIGSSGGRYYLKGDKKIYVKNNLPGSAGNAKKST